MPTAQVDLKMDPPLLAQNTLITRVALALGFGILMEKEVKGTWRRGDGEEAGLAHSALENAR